jgi:hypothetical protein
VMQRQLVRGASRAPRWWARFCACGVGLLIVASLATACLGGAPASTTPEQATLAAAESTAEPTVEGTRPFIFTATPEGLVVPGLGISRAEAAAAYEALGFTFALESGVGGSERYLGTAESGMATVVLEGPDDGITSLRLELQVSDPPVGNERSRMISYTAGLLSLGAPGWDGGTDWLQLALNQPGVSEATEDGLRLVLVNTLSGGIRTIEFTISMA